MKWFPDTSFLCSFYREQIYSEKADLFMKNCGETLPVSSLLLFEFRNSVRLQERLFSNDRSKGFSKNVGAAMLRDLKSDLHSGVLEIVIANWAEVHELAESLSAKYTVAGGHRFADILHVATAIQVEAEGLLSFDDKQCELAQKEGLELL